MLQTAKYSVDIVDTVFAFIAVNLLL